MIPLLITIIPPIISEDNSVTLLLIMIMPQIIHIKEFISLFVFQAFFLLMTLKNHVWQQKSVELQSNIALGEQ